jgi:hypothetical protein
METEHLEGVQAHFVLFVQQCGAQHMHRRLGRQRLRALLRRRASLLV